MWPKFQLKHARIPIDTEPGLAGVARGPFHISISPTSGNRLNFGRAEQRDSQAIRAAFALGRTSEAHSEPDSTIQLLSTFAYETLNRCLWDVGRAA